MKNKGIISLSIVSGIIVAVLIIVLSFSAPESDEIHKGDKNIPVQSEAKKDDIGENPEGYYYLAENGKYYKLQGNKDFPSQSELSGSDTSCGTWEKDDDGSIRLFED